MPGLHVELFEPEDLVHAGERLGGFVFRGHGSSTWDLSSTLERQAERWGVAEDDLHERELTLISAFKRRAHHYVSDPPSSEKWVEWAALLQHYGGPTRLLDVTESLLVAVFFAIEDAQRDGTVWCFNRGKLRPSGGPAYDDDIISRSGGDESKVLLVKPFRMNKRLASQQGAFLLPESVDIPFVNQLEATFGCGIHDLDEWCPRDNTSKVAFTDVCKIDIPKSSHSRLMRFLSRSNVTAESLFGDLSGFARTLRTMMRIYD